MVTILYNLEENKIIGEFRNGYYLVDGIRPTLSYPITELEVIYNDRPSISSLQMAESSWEIQGNNYVQIWTVRDKTPEELEGERIAAIPPEITKRQLNLTLFTQKGIEAQQINNMIDSISDETQRKITQIEWRDGSLVSRTHPVVNAFAAQLGITERELDDLFTYAKDI